MFAHGDSFSNEYECLPLGATESLIKRCLAVAGLAARQAIRSSVDPSTAPIAKRRAVRTELEQEWIT